MVLPCTGHVLPALLHNVLSRQRGNALVKLAWRCSLGQRGEGAFAPLFTAEKRTGFLEGHDAYLDDVFAVVHRLQSTRPNSAIDEFVIALSGIDPLPKAM